MASVDFESGVAFPQRCGKAWRKTGESVFKLMDLETTSMNRGMFRGAVVCSRVPNSNWLKESRRWIDSYTGNSVQARSRVGVGHG